MFAFDPVGSNPANRVANEARSTGAANITDVAFFHLDAAPFYGESVVVVDPISGNTLIPGTDYVFGHEYREATDQVGKPIFGSVIFTDPQRTGTYRFTYQTLGGDFVTAASLALQDGLGTIAGLQQFDWEDITDIPSVFPPTPHTHPLAGVIGLDAILTELAELRSVIASRALQITLDDVVDLREEFVDPLIETLSGIAGSIESLTVLNGILHAEFNSAGTDQVLTNPAPNVWIDTDVEVVAPSRGVYNLTFDGEPVTAETDQSTLSWRWVRDDVALANSRSANAVVTAQAGQVFKIRVRSSAATTSITPYDADKPASLMLIKLNDLV